MAQIVTAAGIDVSKRALDVALFPEQTATLRIDRSQSNGFDKLADWLTEHQVRRIGLEAAGGDEVDVLDALEARGFEVIRFNAHRIRMFAKANGRMAKNDRAEAAVIAQATVVLRTKPPTKRTRSLDPLVELLN